jgi:hypothetical protein
VATFTIGGTTTTFKAVVRGSSQDASEPEHIALTMHFDTVAEWNDAVALMTQRYQVHQPLGGSSTIVDVARGAGVGTLVIEALGTTSALLVELRATTYLPGAVKRQATATFIRTAAWA